MRPFFYRGIKVYRFLATTGMKVCHFSAELFSESWALLRTKIVRRRRSCFRMLPGSSFGLLFECILLVSHLWGEVFGRVLSSHHPEKANKKSQRTSTVRSMRRAPNSRGSLMSNPPPPRSRKKRGGGGVDKDEKMQTYEAHPMGGWSRLGMRRKKKKVLRAKVTKSHGGGLDRCAKKKTVSRKCEQGEPVMPEELSYPTKVLCIFCIVARLLSNKAGDSTSTTP